MLQHVQVTERRKMLLRARLYWRVKSIIINALALIWFIRYIFITEIYSYDIM
jgi:hypothetical protein